MAKKNNPLTCPYCLTKLLEVTGHCVALSSSVIIAEHRACGRRRNGENAIERRSEQSAEMPQAATVR